MHDQRKKSRSKSGFINIKPGCIFLKSEFIKIKIWLYSKKGVY